MKVDGISFNDEWVKTKSEDEFVKEFWPMKHIYPDAPDREAKLRAAYKEHKPATPLNALQKV